MGNVASTPLYNDLLPGPSAASPQHSFLESQKVYSLIFALRFESNMRVTPFTQLLLLNYIPASCAMALPLCSRQARTSKIYQFPNNTWVENLAVRSNDRILATLSTKPDLLYIDPHAVNPSPKLVYSFPASAIGLAGIVELGEDIFYIAAENVTLSTLSAHPGQSSIWRVNMKDYDVTNRAEVSHIATLKEAAFFNGMTALPHFNQLLVTNSQLGVIWRVDVASGAYGIALNTSALKSTNSSKMPLGIDGIQAIANDAVYFTNVATSSFGRVPLRQNLTLAEGVETLWTDPDVELDDFALLPSNHQGGGYFVNGGNEVFFKRSYAGSDAVSIANVSAPTSVRSSRQLGEKVLYVSSEGTDHGHVGGALTKVELAC